MMTRRATEMLRVAVTLLLALPLIPPQARAGAAVLQLDPGPGAPGVWQTMGSSGAAVAITPRDAVAGAAAVRLDFTLPPPSGWAGIVVLAAPNAWGAAPGPAFDLATAGRLTFLARGAAGGEGVRVKVGTAGDQPYGDSTPLPFDTGWLTLSKDWQRITLALEGARLGHIVTPFVLIANRQHNPGGRPTVWLKDVRFERPDE
jgi:hypothetical protein